MTPARAAAKETTPANTAVKRLRMCERWSGEKAAKMAERPRGFKLRHSNRLTGVKNDHTSE